MDFNSRIDEMRDDLIKSTQEIVRIKSIEEEPKPGMPFGEGVAKALDCALEISDKLGFKTVNMDGYVGYAEYGEGEDYVAVLGHLDVVPEGDGWIYPPYGAEIHDGKMYSRGTMDDKAPIMAALYGLKAIKDSGVKLSKRVRVIFGTNEETGSAEIHYYNEREKPPVTGFTPDGEYPIIYAEKGFTSFDVVKDINVKQSGDIIVKYIKGGQRTNIVPDYCEAGIEAKNTGAIVEAAEKFAKTSGYKVSAEVKDGIVVVKSIGVSAHGSVPQLGKNGIMQLVAFLDTLELSKSDADDVIAFLNKYVGMEAYGESFGVGLEDDISGKLSFNLGVLNMDEEKVVIGLNLRYPVKYKFDDMMNPFKARIAEIGARVENLDHQEPLYFPEDHQLIKTLQEVYTKYTGQEATLLAIGGATYAKEMPNIVAFGPIFPGQPDLDHQANEYIEIEELILNAKIYADAIYQLAK